MIQRKIHAIGQMRYDPEKETLAFEDGVIEEKGTRIFVDNCERTYLGVQRLPDRSYDVSNKVCLRELSPEERKATLEAMLEKSPTISNIIRESPLWKVPFNLVAYVTQQSREFLVEKARNARREFRRLLLQAQFPDIDKTKLREYALEYEEAILGFVYQAAVVALNHGGETSELFQEAKESLLTQKEQRVLEKNVELGNNPRWGIQLVEDHIYRTQRIRNRYEKAEEFVERFNLGEDSLLQHYKEKIEASPLHKLQ